MSTPGYPNIFYLVGGTNVPATESARVRYAANGASHIQTLSAYDSCERELNHFAIELAEMQELLAFWDTNRNTAFTWVDETGFVWEAKFRQRPATTHIAGQRYTVISRLLLRRIDQ